MSEVEYTYDALDRRIAKAVDVDGEGPQTAETTNFVYDSAHIWSDFDGSGVVTARYLYGDAIDQLIARYRLAEGTAWYLVDHLGTVRDIVNASGMLVNTITYDSFGQVLSQTNPAASDRFLFAARELDAVTQQYYLRARYYNARTGRFITQDPLKFNAGDTNLYRYTFNTAVNANDPSGTTVVSETAVKLKRFVIKTLHTIKNLGCNKRFVIQVVARILITIATGGPGPQAPEPPRIPPPPTSSTCSKKIL